METLRLVISAVILTRFGRHNMAARSDWQLESRVVQASQRLVAAQRRQHLEKAR